MQAVIIPFFILETIVLETGQDKKEKTKTMKQYFVPFTSISLSQDVFDCHTSMFVSRIVSILLVLSCPCPWATHISQQISSKRKKQKNEKQRRKMLSSDIPSTFAVKKVLTPHEPLFVRSLPSFVDGSHFERENGREECLLVCVCVCVCSRV